MWYITFHKQHFSIPNIQWKWLFPSFGGVRLHMMMMMRFYFKIITWNCFVCGRHYMNGATVGRIIRLRCRYNCTSEQRNCLLFYHPYSFCRFAIPFLTVCYTQIHRFGCNFGIRILGCAPFFSIEIYCLLKLFAVQQNVHHFFLSKGK